MSAADDLVALFRNYGLESLAQEVARLLTDGYEGNALTLQLQQSQAYKERFAGNEMRVAAGLTALNPGEYLQVEEGYRQALASYGLQETFGSRDSLAGLMGKDLSPRELLERIQTAGQAVTTADPLLKQTMRSYYGVNDDDLVAYFLDESVGTELLKRQAVASQVGAAAAAQRAQLDRQTAELLADRGVSGQAVSQALNDNNLDAERSIAQRFGESLTDSEVVASEVGLDAGATQKRDRLASRERALFNQTGITQSGRSRGRAY